MRPSQRDLPVCAMMGLLLGSVAASAQPAPSDPPFQTRVEELGRALQNDPRLKNMSEQERNDGRYSAGGDVSYPTPLHPRTFTSHACCGSMMSGDVELALKLLDLGVTGRALAEKQAAPDTSVDGADSDRKL